MAKDRWLRGLIVSAAVFVALSLAAYFVAGAVGTMAREDGGQIVRDAVRCAALTCYAIEGRYPQTLSYLKENYGLTYDEESYVVVYDAFASNVMPGISVLTKGEEK